MIDNRHIAPHFVFFEEGDKVKFYDGRELTGVVVKVTGDINNWEGVAHIQNGELGGGENGDEPITWIFPFEVLIKWM